MSASPSRMNDLVTNPAPRAAVSTATRLRFPPAHRALPCIPRGMAGLAEVRGPAGDSFWTWREVMYRFLDRMDPEDMQAIAAQAYVEMLESGFTRVGEFHYVHQDTEGAPYADLGELGCRIAAAADETGIALTLLPVFYAHGGFGAAARPMASAVS